MAYGDTVINYPIEMGPFGSARTGNLATYTWTVYEGPTRVGQSGTFKMYVDYAGVQQDPRDTTGYVDYDISWYYHYFREFQDYLNAERRLESTFYATVTPENPRAYRQSYIEEGWIYIEFSSTFVYGRQYDPTPYGSYDQDTLRLWNGARCTVTPEGALANPRTYPRRLDGGHLTARFTSPFTSASEGEVRWTVTPKDADYQDIGEPFTLYSGPEPLDQLIDGGGKRIASVDVSGHVYNRTGSFSRSWIWYTAVPNPNEGGNGTATAGGTAVQSQVVKGDLRGSQSGMHTWLRGNGGTTTLSSGGSLSGGGGSFG